MFARQITLLKSQVLWKAAVALFGVLFVAHTGFSTTLAWNANTETNIAGYRVHYGTSSGHYTQTLDVGKTTTATLSNLTAGTTYYSAVTAYNTSSLESLPSNEVSFTPTTSGSTVVTGSGSGATTTTAPSIWTASTVPTQVDGGPDSSVELGVKFRSDVAGTITGIRFYKAGTNTGTHVGSLWSNTGTKLASATFSNETTSGWQQVNFSSPVSITANTVYVASYHCSTGHYSADDNYFATSGVDNAPLHALASGVSGNNGVYAYGSSSTFPTQSWYNCNYWVDVVFQAATAPSLTGIAITPANPTLATGSSQQLTATGTYNNGTTQNVTSQVAWKSSNTAVATVNSAGAATAVATGTSGVSATMSGLTATTLLTVKASSIAITTTSLPAASLNVAYTGTLAATGGVSPYTWSITSGALPAGLTLNATTGAITGTPTTSSSSIFTVTVTDKSIPALTASKSLTITTGGEVNIWTSTAKPTVVDGGPDNAVELGVKFRSDVAGKIKGIRFYKAGTNTGTHVANLWTSAGTKLASATFSGETASGWQQVNFATPVAINANTVYVASYHCNKGHYSADSNFFASTGVDNPPLHALRNGVSGGNGVFKYSSWSRFPNQTWNAANYWVDVVFSAN
jgi:hypothetical protein